MKKMNFPTLVLIGIFLVLGSAAFAGGAKEQGATSQPAAQSGQEVIRYSMWDQNQAPTYQMIFDNFTKENPGITVQLELTPWQDYWTKLTTQAAGGSCPDLVTMLVINFKTLQSKGVFTPLNDYIAKDKFDLSKYGTAAVDMFTVGGKIYGIPKDFDAMGAFYNKDLLKKAGYTDFPADLQWDPETGGSYLKFLQALTFDKSGKHPNEGGFDPNNIVQYGLLATDRGDVYVDGLVTTLVAENGGRTFNPDTGALTLNEPKARGALLFLWNLFNKWHVTPPLSVIQSSGAEALFYSQAVATWLNGPWMTLAIKKNAAFNWGITKNVPGPAGKSFSRVNSLVDNLYSQSKYKDGAWKLIKYVATKAGQDILGQTGTVIPAYADSSAKYVDYYKKQGLDVQMFIDAYHGDVVTPPSWKELSQASDIASRNFALAFDGTGKVDVDTAINNIMKETTPILVKANAK
jgi:multiple sugar transport system substrate-binding protein